MLYVTAIFLSFNSFISYWKKMTSSFNLGNLNGPDIGRKHLHSSLWYCYKLTRPIRKAQEGTCRAGYSGVAGVCGGDWRPVQVIFLVQCKVQQFN